MIEPRRAKPKLTMGAITPQVGPDLPDVLEVMDEMVRAFGLSGEDILGETQVETQIAAVEAAVEQPAVGGAMADETTWPAEGEYRTKVTQTKEGHKKLSMQAVDSTDAAEVALALRDTGDTMESVVIKGDLSRLTPDERVRHYKSVCESLGLNFATHPFDYIAFEGKNAKTILYVNRGGTDQLRATRNVSIVSLKDTYDEETGIYKVRAHARMPNGREDLATGAVFVGDLAGVALANSYKRAETQAKRRVTLSIVGLGWMDESETDQTSGKVVKVNTETGEITEG